MYTFSAIRRNGKWWIVAIPWDKGTDNEFSVNYRAFSKDLGINHNELKTELVRKWNGFVGDNNMVEFLTKEDADNAINNYMDGLLTAAVLAKQNQQEEGTEDSF